MLAVVIYSALFLVLFAFCEFLYYKADTPVRTTRRVVHIMTGVIAITFPVFLQHFWQAAYLCSSFLILLALSERFKWFKSITAVERKSRGSYLFAVVVLLCFMVFLREDDIKVYLLPIMLLALADPIASYVGERGKFLPYRVFGHTKTVSGSMAFLVSALIIYIFFYMDFLSLGILGVIIVNALILTVTEAVTINGWDNVTVPGMSLALYFLNPIAI